MAATAARHWLGTVQWVVERDYDKLAHRPDSQTGMGQLKTWFDDFIFSPVQSLGLLANAPVGRNDRRLKTAEGIGIQDQDQTSTFDARKVFTLMDRLV